MACDDFAIGPIFRLIFRIEGHICCGERDQLVSLNMALAISCICARIHEDVKYIIRLKRLKSLHECANERIDILNVLETVRHYVFYLHFVSLPRHWGPSL